MRILYAVHQFFPDHVTGTERFTLELARGMAAAGHQVKVVCWDYSGAPARRRRGVEYREYEHAGVPVTAFRRRLMPWDLELGLSPNLDAGDFAEDLLLRGRFDLLHVAHPMHVGAFPEAAARLGIPYVLTLTDYFTICHRIKLLDAKGRPCAGPRGGAACARRCPLPAVPAGWIAGRLRTAGALLGQAARVVAPSDYLARVLRREFPRLSVETVPHGVSAPSRPLPAPRRRGVTFGYLGYFLPAKGIDVLIGAFQGLRQTEARLRIHGFGEPSYEAGLRLAARGDRRISFHGRYSKADLGRILAGLDAVCLPSVWPENSPLVVKEALAHGVPIVASRVGAIRETVRDGVNGLTVAPGDPAALRAALRGLVQNPGRLDDFRARAAAQQTRFDEARRYERIYQDVAFGA